MSNDPQSLDEFIDSFEGDEVISNSEDTSNVTAATDDETVGFSIAEAQQLEDLVEARSANPGSTYGDIAYKVLDENSPLVAQNMIRLALHGKTESTRLTAGKYVLDKVLERGKGGTKLDSFFEDITKFANEGELTSPEGQHFVEDDLGGNRA